MNCSLKSFPSELFFTMESVRPSVSKRGRYCAASARRASLPRARVLCRPARAGRVGPLSAHRALRCSPATSSWSRPEHFWGWAGFGPAEKILLFRPKNSANDHPIGRIEPQLSDRAWAGLGLGRAARAFYSVKQLKTSFQAGIGPIFFAGFKIFAHARPVRSVDGPGADRTRTGLKMLWYIMETMRLSRTMSTAPVYFNNLRRLRVPLRLPVLCRRRHKQCGVATSRFASTAPKRLRCGLRPPQPQAEQQGNLVLLSHEHD
jgi:hypothetical protein